jgi:SAM-dependent methyltransferase
MLTAVRYERQRAAAFFDDYAEREWSRFEDGRTSRTSLIVHTDHLRRSIRAGDRVLDAGAGPGRFTLELVRLGARVVVCDVSAVQLALNRATLEEAGLASGVESWLEADILDLGALVAGSFDAVVCYGGPLSYVVGRADEAVDELLRVLRPGGLLLVSVMSLLGSTAAGLPFVIEEAREHGPEAVAAVIETGDLPASLSGHLEMHLYRWSELEALLLRHGCEVVSATASNLSFDRLHHDLTSSMSDKERAWLSRWELALVAEPGAISMGEHIVAVARKRAPGARSQESGRPTPDRAAADGPVRGRV